MAGIDGCEMCHGTGTTPTGTMCQTCAGSGSIGKTSGTQLQPEGSKSPPPGMHGTVIDPDTPGAV